MKKEEELMRNLTDMARLTSEGKLNWIVKGQTTEYNDVADKATIKDDDAIWTIDECFVSYECNYKGEDFVMITYELIHTCGDKKRSTNLVFMPPLGIRYFDVSILLPYSIEASQILIYEIHQLWLMILEMNKAGASNIQLDMSPR